ncbi:CPBP family intramembrane glutamic endopeptidase [Sporolactobacillus pectinivorans]|uniref:CPBP family intramembrane glutamic endopeptidase n=1 Tax=Sporolactobacillus pectinivorans TaxID=1591408 RepID=UPI0012FE41AF|nr:CPBP family intramembrane glutamic endopeptidase [Sporolactobacillus pectinivorans]
MKNRNGLIWTIGIPYLVAFISVYLWMAIAQIVSVGIYLHQHGGSQSEAINAMRLNWGVQSIINVLMELVLLSVLIFFSTREGVAFTWSRVGFVKNRSSMIVGVGLAILINVIVFSIAYGLGTIHGLTIGTAIYSIVSVLFFTVISCVSTGFPGVIEEMFFRGYLQTKIMKSKGSTVAIVVTSLLFALMHIALYPTILGLSTVLLLGLILGVLYYKTKSLSISIGFHYAWDFLNSVVGDGKQPSVFSIHDLTAITTQNILLLIQLIVLIFVLAIILIITRNVGIDVSKVPNVK